MRYSMFASVGLAHLLITLATLANVQHSAPWGARIKTAINWTLASKGWTQVDSAGDVSIVVLQMTKEHPTLSSYYDQEGYGG